MATAGTRPFRKAPPKPFDSRCCRTMARPALIQTVKASFPGDGAWSYLLTCAQPRVGFRRAAWELWHEPADQLRRQDIEHEIGALTHTHLRQNCHLVAGRWNHLK